MIKQFILIYLTVLPLVIFSEQQDGRHSFSLTTFDPAGKLEQVQRALQAAEHGSPIIGVVVNDTSIILAAPQVLPYFAIDDGSSRFALITPEIVIAHSGLSADGRILVAAAQRLAVEHEYFFDENIPISIFLEELSLLFQEYTLKPGTRPFGASIVIAYVPSAMTQLSIGDKTPELYRIDPSGNIENLGKTIIVHGSLLDKETLYNELKMAQILDKNKVASLLMDALKMRAKKKGINEGTVDDITILSASLSMSDQGEGFVFEVDRHCTDTNSETR
jgi:20S proteasome alpha/beta subunit